MNFKTSFLCASLALAPGLRADFVGIYDYMAGLGGVYAPQTGNEKWTFHTGDQNGTLMGLYGGVGYGNIGGYAQFSAPAAAGLMPPGTAGTNETAGIFTHTAAAGYTAAVFHADSTFTAESLVFTHELVGNGNLGNGLDLTLRTVIDGNVVDRGTFAITNIYTAQTAFTFGVSGLTFDAGDEIVVLFSARGNFNYDHGWWDLALQEVDQQNGDPGHNVPDTAGTAMLLALGLAGLATARRLRRTAA